MCRTPLTENSAHNVMPVAHHCYRRHRPRMKRRGHRLLAIPMCTAEENYSALWRAFVSEQQRVLPVMTGTYRSWVAKTYPSLQLDISPFRQAAGSVYPRLYTQPGVQGQFSASWTKSRRSHWERSGAKCCSMLHARACPRWPLEEC